MFGIYILPPKITASRSDVGSEIYKKLLNLRYLVYCEEAKYLNATDYPEKMETDKFDKHSVHVAVTLNKQLAGCMRIIKGSEIELPLFSFFADIEKPTGSNCEVSRFIIAPQFRSNQKIRKAVFKEIIDETIRVVIDNDIRFVYATLEEWLLKSLVKRGLNFEIIGKPKNVFNTLNYPTMLDMTKLIYDGYIR